MKKKISRILVLGLIFAMLSPTIVSAETRQFLFNMNTSHAPAGGSPNRGYPASKDDNEQNAYITVTQFDKVGSPQISMWVAPSGYTRELTLPWTWTSTASRKLLEYAVTVSAGDSHWLCAEQFGSGSVDMSGRWTP